MRDKRRTNGFYVTGADGYLGQRLLQRSFSPLRSNVLDIAALDREIAVESPGVVLHLAGKTDTDWCEAHQEEASKANVRGTFNLLSVCEARKIPVILLSTYHIWGGGWLEWGLHKEDAKMTTPRNYYGITKLAAESLVGAFNSGTTRHKIVRTSFIFDRSRLSAELKMLKEGREIFAPTFLRRSFIHLEDFVYSIYSYCQNYIDMPPVLHLAGSETVSYYEFWLEVAHQYGYDPKLVRPRRREVNRDYLAKRPHNGGLDTSLSRKLHFRQFDYIGGIRRMKDEG